MKVTEKSIKRYQNDPIFNRVVDGFFNTMKQVGDEMGLTDYIKAIRLADYKYDLYNDGIHTNKGIKSGGVYE